MSGVLAPRLGSADVGAMPAKPQRRRFTVAYKLQILQEAARCTKPGEVSALLRREGLYSSHLAAWRRAARDRGGRAGLARRRGPHPQPVDPNVQRIAGLERQLAQALRRAERAEAVVEVQKKVAALLGDPLRPTNDEPGGSR